MMTESEVVKRAIWFIAQKMIDKNKSGYVQLQQSALNRINHITKQAVEFLEQYIDFKKSVYASAALMKVSGAEEMQFNSKTNAIQSLDDKLTKVLNLSHRQNDVRREALKKIWNNDLLLAAGRLMQAASMGVDYDPSDMGIVDEAKRRGPLLVVCSNKVSLGIEQNPDGLYPLDQAMKLVPANPLDQAMKLVPANPPIIWMQTNHPLEPQDDTQTTYLKELVSTELWTKEVLLAAGKITAARSLALTPSWEDIERVSKADHLSRLSVVKLKEIVLKMKTDDDEIFYPANLIKKAIKDVESGLIVSRPINQAISYAVQEKVAQYVWTSHPEFVQAKANLDKHGDFYTAHGDVMLVQTAQIMEHRLLNAVAALLQEKERQRINKTQTSFISWLWGRTATRIVESQEVSVDLSKEIFENEMQERSKIGKLISPSWLYIRQYTLQLTPTDVTNQLIDDSVKKAVVTIREEKAGKQEHEEMRKARETSWWW